MSMKSRIKTGGFVFVPLMVVVALFVGVGAGVVITNIGSNIGTAEVAPQDTDSEGGAEASEETEVGVYNDAEIETRVDTSVGLSVPVPALIVPSPKNQKQTQLPSATGLAVENISASAGEEDVSISWTTSIESDSRLVLHNDDTEKIFVSKNDSGTEHSVYIDALAPSKEYSYEIIATADGKEVRKFSSVQTKRVYTFRKASYISTSVSEGECMIFLLEDTQGRALTNTQVTISGSSTNYAIGAKSYTTNDRGEIKFCQKAIELKVVVPSIAYTFKSTGLVDWTVTRNRN